MTDEFTRGFLEGVEVAARIFRNHIGGIRQPAEDPTMPATGPTLAQDGLSGSGGTSGRGEGCEAAHEPLGAGTLPIDRGDRLIAAWLATEEAMCIGIRDEYDVEHPITEDTSR